MLTNEEGPPEPVYQNWGEDDEQFKEEKRKYDQEVVLWKKPKEYLYYLITDNTRHSYKFM